MQAKSNKSLACISIKSFFRPNDSKYQRHLNNCCYFKTKP